MEEEIQKLHQPLLHTTTACSAEYGSSSSTSPSAAGDALAVKVLNDNHIDNIKLISSNSSIFFRLTLIFLIGVVSIWANYEPSKGFDITIVNEANNTPLGKRFALFYISNDRVSRFVINTSKFVEEILYPSESSYAKKQVNHVVVRLTGRNLTTTVAVDSLSNHEYVLTISPTVMEVIDSSSALFSALLEGMARIWLHNGHGNAPRGLVNGKVKYITYLALANNQIWSTSDDDYHHVELSIPKTTLCWDNKNAIAVAQFLNYCEKHRNGFIRELNQAMKDGWLDQMMDDALGMWAQRLCTSHVSPINSSTI